MFHWYSTTKHTVNDFPLGGKLTIERQEKPLRMITINNVRYRNDYISFIQQVVETHFRKYCADDTIIVSCSINDSTSHTIDIQQYYLYRLEYYITDISFELLIYILRIIYNDMRRIQTLSGMLYDRLESIRCVYWTGSRDYPNSKNSTERYIPWTYSVTNLFYAPLLDILPCSTELKSLFLWMEETSHSINAYGNSLNDMLCFPDTYRTLKYHGSNCRVNRIPINIGAVNTLTTEIDSCKRKLSWLTDTSNRDFDRDSKIRTYKNRIDHYTEVIHNLHRVDRMLIKCYKDYHSNKHVSTEHTEIATQIEPIRLFSVTTTEMVSIEPTVHKEPEKTTINRFRWMF